MAEPDRSPLPPPLADILACIGFFTRITVPGTGRPFASALWAAPVAGALVGLIVGGVLIAALALGLPAGPSAALALAAGILITGALHEDGAADVADGFGGGRDRERKLAIMRDSRIGTYGTLALGLSLISRWAALSVLCLAPAATAVAALVAAHAASRALLPAFMAKVPPARADGLSAGVATLDLRTAAGALALGLLALLPLGFAAALATVAVIAVAFFTLEHLCKRQIGGQTGDVLGALQQIAEIAILFIAVASMP